MHLSRLNPAHAHSSMMNMTRLYAFLRIGMLLVVFIFQSISPAVSFAALDIYKNADSGFIEASQSMRVNGNFFTTGNFTLTGGYFDYRPAGVPCSSGQVLSWSGTVSRWLCGSDQ